MKKYIEESELLNNVFTITDPNVIANTLMLELNSIINNISPISYIQRRNNYIPYMKKQTKEEVKKTEELYLTSKNSQKRRRLDCL